MSAEAGAARAERDRRARAWALLVLSGILEAVWATALGASEGFSRPGPGLLFAVTLVLSMLTLARAARVVPMGTAYAVWTGIGAVLTVAWAAGTAIGFAEPWKKLREIASLLIA